ncbi:transgelin-3, partial [Biomphalaria glabrata]
MADLFLPLTLMLFCFIIAIPCSVQETLTDESVLQSTDLWEGLKGPVLNVINCIHSLGYL